jgi:hypothetical protein
MEDMTLSERRSTTDLLSDDERRALEELELEYAPLEDMLAASLAAVSTETERLYNERRAAELRAYTESLVAALPPVTPAHVPDDVLGRAGPKGLPREPDPNAAYSESMRVTLTVGGGSRSTTTWRHHLPTSHSEYRPWNPPHA